MADRRKNNGGKRANAGRKAKAAEGELQKLLARAFTSADRIAVIQRLATQARAGDVKAATLLLAYAYGKPTERIELTGKDGEPIKTITTVEVVVPT